MVSTDACNCATCASSAMVTLSRKRRCTRVLMVRRNHVAAVDTPNPMAATCTRPSRWLMTPRPNNISHRARSASGSAASCESTSDAIIKRGSWRYPSLHNRHMEDSAGGRGSMAGPRSGEDVIRGALLVAGNTEALCLKIKHGPITPAKRHQFVVGAKLDDPSVLEHADTIGVANGGETMRDQDGGAMAGCSQQAIEYLRFTADVELCCRFVEQHDAGAELDGRQRPG